MQKISIGRDTTNDFVIPHPQVSSFHGDIYLNDNGVVNSYMDHSTNGSKINGHYVHQSGYPLSQTDVISLPGGIDVPVSTIVGQTANVAGGGTQIIVPNQYPLQNHPVPYSGNVYGNPSYGTILPPMSFGQTLRHFFEHYVDFSGRARRTEYWYITLWILIFSLIPIVNILFWLGSIIPCWALSARRLHDTGRSALWLLILLLPFVGGIVIFIFSLMDSEPGINKWGPSPKYK